MAMNTQYLYKTKMTEGPSRAAFSAEDVIDMVTLEDCDEDDDDVDEVFFPGSDDELGFETEADSDIDDDEELDLYGGTEERLESYCK